MKERDTVALRTKRGELAAGTIGVIVHENVSGKEFIVEFIHEDGSTRALEDISADELVLVTQKFDLGQMYWATCAATQATRIGQIFHIRRNRVGSGSVSTPIARYFVWQPEYEENVNPHWRVDCFVNKHRLARKPEKLAKLLVTKLIALELCSQPVWSSWHKSVEIGGEPIGDLWDFE